MKSRILIACLVIVALPDPGRASVRNFFAPELDGRRLDSCLAGNEGCGKPAADAYCRAQGYETAVLFQREAAKETVMLGDGAQCNGPACVAFRQIKCQSTIEISSGS
ncbi:MAG: hypothetical protein FJX63_08110 [Alphaproteobacteria bacterium]|nr:hypothetical protein [Alphaproteobacteria bacterium]